MTEDHKRLLAVFDVRVRDLMEFCDRQKEKINELESSLAQKEGEGNPIPVCAAEEVTSFCIECPSMTSREKSSSKECL